MASNAIDKEKVLKETEAMLRAVLISSPRGVRFEKLLKDYKEITFKTIPFKELGYPRLENFLQSIPAVARVEKGADGEWIVKGVASDADQHVAKLISKQNKPKVRKSAKSIPAKRRVVPVTSRLSTPVRKPTSRSPGPQPGSSKYVLPPRMQRLQEVSNKSTAGSTARQIVKSGKIKENPGTKNLRVVSVARGELFSKAIVGAKTSKESPKLTVSISKTSNEKNVTSVAAKLPGLPVATGVLDDPASVKWIRAEILKVPNGLWATRLEHFYKQKFNKTLPQGLMEELKFRPDIATIEEPMAGKFLLYAPRKRTPSISKASPTDHDQEGITIPCRLPDVGTTIAVYISHTENLSCFYVSRSDAISEYLSDEMCKCYKSSHYNSEAIPSVLPGQIFCAQFTEDGNFYRACVLEVVDSKQVKVLYVDFGNKEVIPVERLRVLISEFQTQDIQAYECCLDGVQPPDQGQEWSKEAITKFDDLTSSKKLRMTVHDVDDEKLSVSLYDDLADINIAEVIKKEGLAISTKNLDSTPSSSSSSLSSSSGANIERPSPRMENISSRSRRHKFKAPEVVQVPEDQPFVDVFVCNITGTYNVYLRLVGEESTKFEAMQESMTSYYSDSKDEVTTEPSVGDLFALPSDEVWCRVEVTRVNGDKIEVYFVDHGDATETTMAELRPLALQFRQLPLQVFQCALEGLPKTKNPDVVDKLKKLIMGEVAVAEVVRRTGDLTFIELLDTRTDANITVNSVIRKLVIPDEELKPVLPKVGQTTEVDIAYISPTGSLFLHVSAAGNKRLEELNRDLTEHYTSKRSKASEFISKPTAGKVCCAKCIDDENWYRAKILSFSDKNNVNVLYVDYGNTEVVPSTNLREPTQANAHVLSLPLQALECQLYDVPKDGWSEEVIDKIFEIAEQGSLTAEVLSDGDLPLVSLLVTVETETGPATDRLANWLGYATKLDDLQGIHNDAKQSLTTDDQVEGPEGLVNEDKQLANIDSGNVENKVGLVNDHTRVVTAETDNVFVETENHVKGISLVVKQNQLANQESPAADEASAVIVREECLLKQENGSRDVNKAVLSENSTNVNENERDQDGSTSEQAGAVQKRQWRPLPLQTGWMDVMITEAKDPEHFTFLLLGNSEEFSQMLDELHEFYQDQATESDVTLVEGGVFAVLYEDPSGKVDECWYRGLIESVIKDEKAYVRFLDYGGHEAIEKDNIRVLDEKFLQLPFQGVQAKLAGVKCTKKKWSKECIKDFRFHTIDQYLAAKVTSGDTEYFFDSSSDVSVELCDTSDATKDVYIATQLIEKYSEAVADNELAMT